MDKLRIATRKSRLALWQAGFVKGELERLHPGLAVELVQLSTEGDRRLGGPLRAVGGKGLFIKELEAALLRGEADIAVHSMKDVPARLDHAFRLAAIGVREEVRDAWVSAGKQLDAIHPGARVGSSSLRRQAQILAARPDLEVVPLRGNVDTRLRKLDAGEFDALVLAMCGLVRLGWAKRATEILSLERCLPAPGQGALGIECLADNERVQRLAQPLNDPAICACVMAERGVSAALGADCGMPLGACAELDGGRMRLRAVLGFPDGRTLLRAEASGDDGDALAATVAASLERQGGGGLLASLRRQGRQ